MIDLHGVASVLRFQGRRSLTVSRIVWWLVLVGFAPLVISLVRWAPSAGRPPEEAWGILLYGLIPCVTCMLGVFLWATPVLQAEVEEKSWVYVAMRPEGGTSLLLGNYLIALVWTASAALLALTLAVWLSPSSHRWQLWSVFSRLALLSIWAYASLYLVIGVVFVKRAMLVALAYTLLFELVLGLLPAVVNQLTIQYRLRSLWARWIDWGEIPQDLKDLRDMFGQGTAWQHVLVLAAMAMGLTIAALLLVRRKELATGGDTEF